MSYVVPAILILVILYGIYKKVNVYDCFVEGGKEGLKLIVSVFPYLSAVFILISLLNESGLSLKIAGFLEKPLELLGIPKELSELLILRPFSGGGSLALLDNIYKEYGVDSTIALIASTILGSTETILYITAVYLSKTKIKRLNGALIISLIASLFGTVIASICVKAMI